MRKCIFLTIGILALATGLVAQEGKKIWNFDTDKPELIAKGFTGEVGDWKVVADATAPSPPYVFAQTARNRGSTFNLALVDGSRYKDLVISVKMRAVAGKEDQGGGLVWRVKDAKNYYVARYNPLEDNYILYKVVKGRRLEIKGATLKKVEGWHTLTVSMEGDRIECLLDGKKYLEAEDSAFREAGKIGLWTKSDAQTHFDDLTVSEK